MYKNEHFQSSESKNKLFKIQRRKTELNAKFQYFSLKTKSIKLTYEKIDPMHQIELCRVVS